MDKKEDVKTGLTAEEIGEFKSLLLVKRREILGNVMSMEDETLRRERNELSNMPVRMADGGTDNYEIEHTMGLMDSERKLISEIDEALRRIEEGTYGICQGSGKPIPKARLEAIPWAKYCVEHARVLEKGQVKREDSVNNTNYNFGSDEGSDEGPGGSYRKAV